MSTLKWILEGFSSLQRLPNRCKTKGAMHTQKNAKKSHARAATAAEAEGGDALKFPNPGLQEPQDSHRHSNTPRRATRARWRIWKTIFKKQWPGPMFLIYALPYFEIFGPYMEGKCSVPPPTLGRPPVWPPARPPVRPPARQKPQKPEGIHLRK